MKRALWWAAFLVAAAAYLAVVFLLSIAVQGPVP